MGRSAFLGLLLALAWGAGALACAAWAWLGAPPARLAAGLAASAAAGAWAAHWWWRRPVGWLSWDGSRWTWSPGEGERLADGAGSVDAALDLQSSLLLRWSGDGRRAWLWAERPRLAARWDALRRAVYSRADADALSGAEPPSTRP